MRDRQLAASLSTSFHRALAFVGLSLVVFLIGSPSAWPAQLVEARTDDGQSLAAQENAVAVDTTIRLTFDDANTSTTDLTLVGPNGPVTFQRSSNGAEVELRTRGDLLPSSRYTLFVQNPADKSLQTISFQTKGSLVAPIGSSASSAIVLHAGASTHAACAANRVENGFAFCADEGTVTDGVFRPGARNSHGRWRTNVPLPDVPTKASSSAERESSGDTTVFGVVRRIDDTPLGNVSVSIGSQNATTDSTGQFALAGIPAGHQKLIVDGSSANNNGEEYGRFSVAISINAHQNNRVPFNLYVPRIAEQDKITIASPTAAETILTHPAMPGLEIHIPAGTVLRDHAGKTLTNIALVPLPADRSPVPLPDNFPVYYSLQPGDLTVEALSQNGAQGIQVVYPNYTNAMLSGEKFWYYDADRDGWTVYAKGRVSDDGRSLISVQPFGSLALMPAGVSVGPNGKPTQQIKKCTAGDPVDCATGTFLHSTTDLSVNDVSAMGIGHSYNSSDFGFHSFGRGMANSFGMFLSTNSASCVIIEDAGNEIDIIDTDGSIIPLTLVSGAGTAEAIYKNISVPGRFFGAFLYLLQDASTLYVQLSDGSTIGFTGGCPAVASSFTDRFGNTSLLSFNAGLVNQITLPSGRYFKFTYNASNFVSSVADDTGRTVNYAYVGNNLDTVTYPDSTTEKYTYDTNGNMLTVQDRRGNTMVTNHYDANQRVDQQTYPDGGVYHFAYTLSGSQVTATDVTDSRGKVKHITFDGAGYPLSVTRAYGTSSAQQVTMVRNATEMVTDRTDALSRVTHMTYDSAGDVLTQTFLYGTSNAATYTYTYTPDTHMVASIKDPLNHTTTYGYTGGCLTSVKDALNHSTTITCNGSGQPLTIKDALNHTTTLTYDGTDPRTYADALGHTSTLSTDAWGRVIDANDPLGRASRATYDSNGRTLTSTDALNQTTNYTYDGNGNLTDVVDPNGGHTQYGYDTRNRRNSRTDALNHGESWTYDGEGNVLTYTDRKGQLTQYQYDALNRVSLITYNDGSTVTPTFDAGNRLTSIVDSVSGTINRSYDGLDNLQQEQTPQGTVNYTYDAASRRATMTPASQTQIVYTFDNADRLTNITQGTQIVTIGYDNANRRTSLTLPNGVVTSYGYDNADELTTLTYKNSSGTTLASTTYGYDAAGQRISRTGGFGSDLLPTPNTGTNTFNLNNQQTVWNSFSLGYDLNGDPTSNGVTSPATTYTFDARHRLTTILQGTSTVASFQYDTFGRRTQKTVGSTTTNFLYDGNNGVQETQGTTVNAILTGLGIDERYARTEAAGTRYFFTDALGSAVALTDSSQAVQAIYSFEPYGEVTSTGTSDNPYQYTGRENDSTGLYYYRARYYSPSLKRFISEDPIGLRGGLNEYAYVNGNPVSKVDRLGLVADIDPCLGYSAQQCQAFRSPPPPNSCDDTPPLPPPPPPPPRVCHAAHPSWETTVSILAGGGCSPGGPGPTILCGLGGAMLGAAIDQSCYQGPDWEYSAPAGGMN